MLCSSASSAHSAIRRFWLFCIRGPEVRRVNRLDLQTNIACECTLHSIFILFQITGLMVLSIFASLWPFFGLIACAAKALSFGEHQNDGLYRGVRKHLHFVAGGVVLGSQLTTRERLGDLPVLCKCNIELVFSGAFDGRQIRTVGFMFCTVRSVYKWPERK